MEHLNTHESTKPTEPAERRPFLAEDKLSFKEIIDAAVNETIFGLLGQDGAQSFFNHIRDERGIPRGMVAQRLDMLFLTLDQVFGVSSRTVGRAIIRNLYKTLGLKFAENSIYSLSDYVEEALFDYVGEVVTLSQPKRLQSGTPS
jgi:hypothetical protein